MAYASEANPVEASESSEEANAEESVEAEPEESSLNEVSEPAEAEPANESANDLTDEQAAEPAESPDNTDPAAEDEPATDSTTGTTVDGTEAAAEDEGDAADVPVEEIDAEGAAEEGATDENAAEAEADTATTAAEDEELIEDVEDVETINEPLEYTPIVSGDYTYYVSASVATIIGYSGSAANLTLPTKIDGYNVKYIQGPVFSSNTKLKSLTVPGSYLRVGDIADVDTTGTFEGCSNLQSVTFESGGGNFIIGYSAFRKCTGLTSLTIPGNCTKILGGAFYGCSGLATVTIQSGTKTLQIGNSVFQSCTSLTTFNVTGSVTSIGEEAFSGDTRLKNLSLGGSLATIGGGAFYNCDALESVTLPATITNIGYNRDGTGAFENCDKLSSVTLTAGSDAAYLGYSTFESCPALKTITIPGNYSDVADSSFKNCTALTTVTMSNGSVEQSIGKNAFIGCTKLATVTTSTNLRSIGVNAFYKDTAIKTLTLKEGLTSIGGGAFYQCTGLESVTIPSTVTAIGYNWDGNGAFQNCTNLATLTLKSGSGDAYIGYNAFKDCDALEGTLTIPGNYKNIYNKAFQSCNVLTQLDYGTDGTSATQVIGQYAFADCTSLVKFTTSKSLKEIGDYAFSNDTKLKTVSFTAGLASIGEGSFLNCQSLVRVRIPSTVTEIGSVTAGGKGAFQGCRGLIGVVINDGSGSATGKTLGYNVFAGCTKLSAVYIPASYTHIIWSISWGGLPRVTIWGQEGSAAQTFAGDHNIPFNVGQPDLSSLVVPLMDDDVIVTSGSFTYDGTEKKASIVVIVGETTLVSGTDYTVEYKDNINAGPAKAIIKGIGDYSGTVTVTYTINKGTQTITGTATYNKSYGSAAFKLDAQAEGTLTYKSSDTSVAAVSSDGTVTVKGVGKATITVTATSDNYEKATKKVTVNVKPVAFTVSSLVPYNGSKIQVKYTKAEGVSGYRIQYADNSSMSGAKMVTISGNTSTSKVISGLTNGKTYYVRIRTYQEVSGTTYWSNWSAKKSAKVVQNPYPTSVSSLTNVSGRKMKVVWKKVSTCGGYRIQYSLNSDMSNGTLVTISGANNTSKTITGLKKGKTYYVRVRTFRKVSGTTYWSKWSAKKSVKITK